MKEFLRKYFGPIFLVPLLFLIFGVYTLKDYGVNWDEPLHFMRGQAYLNFFLYGKKDYSNLPPYPRLGKECPQWANKGCNISPGGATDILPSGTKGIVYQDAIKWQYPKGFLKLWRSFYQHDIYDFNSIVASEDGHPPLNDILAAFTNYILFQRLHLLGDLETYHFFEIFSSFLLVLGVSFFVYHKLGVFPTVVASASLALYPLFFSESHFNIKDPPETVFFGLTIILFYFGIVKNNWKLIITSAVFSAFALGTKFNAVFIAPIYGIWLIFYLITLLISRGRKIISKNNFKKILPLILSLIIYPVITLGIFYALWPFLWPDPLKNTMSIFGYYKQIGMGVPAEMTPFIINGWNTYPILWIIYTTPIPVLFLSAIGFARSVIKALEGDSFSFLIILWFLVPVLRVSWPNTNIYGGIRQIMEFVPALAVLSGIGAYVLTAAISSQCKQRKLVIKALKVLITLSLAFVFFELVKVHPNENVYFNQLIGGLSGARNKNIPAWGSAYGNVYLQGVNWINKNAEPNARLGLAVSTMGNIPRLNLRSDIEFFNGNYSGLDRKGEYEMEMDYDWWPKNFYSFQYLDIYLNPVYIVEVDGVPLLKVWKNDLAHTKKGYENEKDYPIKNVDYSNYKILIDLGREIYLTRVGIKHSSMNCEAAAKGYVATSVDNDGWQREYDPLGQSQVPNVDKEINKNSFVFLFPAKKARYIMLDPLSTNSCLSKLPVFEIRGLEDLP